MSASGTETTSNWSLPKVWAGLHKPVFIPASLLIIGLLVFAVIYGRTGGDAFENLNAAISNGIGWWYILIATFFVGFAVYVGVSRIGNIRLGRDDEGPEFTLLSWFTMLFSAGMGIGLVFYGVAEPLSHYVTPPEAGGIEGGTDAAAGQAMDLTMFHWGLHAWAIYVVVGLGLAFMTFRKGRPLSVRWLLEPLLGRERVEGWIGHAIDTIAVVGTLFGVATSLGFGVQQIMAGLDYLGFAEESAGLVIGLIAIITGIATFSVVSGVHKGLKWLSNINMLMAAGLLLFVFLAGGVALFLAQSWVQNLGGYLSEFPELMMRTAPLAGDTWSADWTIFYWGWWMSWAPFVGMFIARISRGRTIREFVAGVLLAPTIIGTIWFTVFGDSAILREREVGDLLVDGEVNTNTTLFQLLETMPLSLIMSILAIIVIVFFFVTSSDSGSLVIDILCTGGDLEPPRLTRVYWSVLEGVAAAVLLLVGGAASLTALQTVSIATAVPFSIVMVLACISLLKAFHYEAKTQPRYVTVRATGTEADMAQLQFAAENGDGPKPTPENLTATASTGARGRRYISATFAGLSSGGERKTMAAPSDAITLAVHEVPREALHIDPETGALGVDEDKTVKDPIGGEVFDTPEFAESPEGQIHLAQNGDSGVSEESVSAAAAEQSES